MTKKVVAILLATFMCATMFASIGVADIDVKIPEDAPDDVEIPDTLPILPIISVKDEHGTSSFSLPDLAVTDLWTDRIDDNYYEVWYRLYNTGEADIVNEYFYDAAWIFNDGYWNQIESSIKYHSSFDLDEEEYSSYYNFYFYPPTGWHTISQWTDIYDQVDEIIEDDDNPTNNEDSLLWYWH